jgi:hypothetical protein
MSFLGHELARYQVGAKPEIYTHLLARARDRRAYKTLARAPQARRNLADEASTKNTRLKTSQNCPKC